jgi:hypothetical protein
MFLKTKQNRTMHTLRIQRQLLGMDDWKRENVKQLLTARVMINVSACVHVRVNTDTNTCSCITRAVLLNARDQYINNFDTAKHARITRVACAAHLTRLLTSSIFIDITKTATSVLTNFQVFNFAYVFKT